MKIFKPLLLCFPVAFAWMAACYFLRVPAPWASLVGLVLGSASYNFGLWWFNLRGRS